MIALLLILHASPAIEVERRKVLTDDGLTLALYRYGGGSSMRPVLLLPDFGMNRGAYDFRGEGLARYLAAKGRTVYIAELRGQGNASKRTEGFRLADLVAHDLPAVANALAEEGFSRFDLVAHGYSGSLALAASTVELKGRVAKVVAIATPVFAEVPNLAVERVLLKGGRLQSEHASADFALIFLQSTRIRASAEPWRAFDDLGAVASEDLLEWMLTGDFSFADGSTLRGRLARYDRPTLQILSLGDSWANPELASPLREVATHAAVTLKTLSRLGSSEDYSHLSELQGRFAVDDVFAPTAQFLAAP